MIFDLLRKSEPEIIDSRSLGEYLGMGWQTPAGVNVSPETAMKFAPVFACIRVIAESVGQLPLALYEEKNGIKAKASNHAISSLVRLAPNSYMTTQDYRETMVAHLCLRGNFYAYNNRVNGKLIESLPLNPDSVTVKQNDDWELEYEVTLPNGEIHTLTRNEITHIKLLSLDGIKGLSLIAQHRNVIGMGIASEQYASNLFQNGARPAGILSTDKDLKEAQREDIQKAWQSQYGGSHNAFKTAVLYGGMKWTALNISPEDAQFVETQKLTRSQIAGIFRVPPHLIADMEKATFSNIEQQSLDFVIQCLMPWLRRIELGLALSWLTENEQKRLYFKHNLNGLLRGDMQSRANFYKEMRYMGVMNADDIRDLEDMNPLPDGQGQHYLIPMNHQTIPTALKAEQESDNDGE